MTSQEQQAKYDALVREIAEEMARDDYGERWSYLFNTEDRHSIIKKYINPARIAVKHMAQEATKAFKSATTTAYRPEHVDKLSESYLHENGLMPPKSNENE